MEEEGKGEDETNDIPEAAFLVRVTLPARAALLGEFDDDAPVCESVYV